MEWCSTFRFILLNISPVGDDGQIQPILFICYNCSSYPANPVTHVPPHEFDFSEHVFARVFQKNNWRRYEAKRFMGKNFSTITSQVLDRFPFKIMESEGDGRVAFRVTGEGAKLKMLSPEEIGGMVVGELKHTAEEQLGAKIKLAVMSVPAEFNEAQRNATIRAGELAGLEVLRVLSEPTAAAMAYGLHNKAQVEYIVVFDFGGGTLDVSLLRVDGGMYSTYAVAGNKHLGGEDLSHRLYLHGLTLFEAERGVKMRSAISMQRLRSAVERAKILLSKVDSTIMFVELDRADESSSSSSSSSGDGATFKVPVTRKMFEAINADLFEKVMAPLHRVLDDAEVDKSEIDEVVLVGGSTRIPKVRELLTIFLGKPPCSSIDPDEAVAVGVSMQAGILGGAWPLQVSVLEAPWTGESVELE